jgi:hypothetical protein
LNPLDVLARRLEKEEARRPLDEDYCALLRELIEGERRWLELKKLAAEFEPQLENLTAALKRGIARKRAAGEELKDNPDKLLKALHETQRAMAKLKKCP